MNTNLIDTNLNTDSLIQAKTASLAKFANKGELIGKKLDNVEKAGMVKAARGFEAIFVNMMLKQMKEGLNKDKEQLMTFGAETLEGYTDMQFADEIANTGKGIGLAEMIYKQLSGGENLDYKSKIVEFSPKFNLPEKAVLGNFNANLTQKVNNFSDIITDASKTHNIDEKLIKAVIAAESGGNKNAVSPAGAKGLMQIMDKTANELGIQNVFNPKDNIEGGTKYLKSMISMFGDVNLGLAAYNSGPSNVMKYGDIPPFNETQNYVKKVQQYLNLFN